jgi:hypothetical protein
LKRTLILLSIAIGDRTSTRKLVKTLQRSLRGDLVKEIGTWHAQKFPLYEVNAATFYIYGRSSSNAREIEEKARAVY